MESMAGKWIKDRDGFYCSECGSYIDPFVDLGIEDYHFCPNCGLKMENDDE